MIDFKNKAIFKLKHDKSYANLVEELLVDNEEIISSFKSMRDGVVFTSLRVIAVNVQGITGSKKDFTSLPYKSITAFSVETAGTFDLDSELEIVISTLGKIKFEFTGDSNVKEISILISNAIL